MESFSFTNRKWFRMNKNLVIIGCLVIVAQAQDYRLSDSKNARILQEARYLQGGTHGAAYVQDDGTEFNEETDADGTRIGSYSYIDDTGKKITVQYTAGKMGFVVNGDHLPKAPEPMPVSPPQNQYQQPKQYNPPPQYNSLPPNHQFSFNSDNPQGHVPHRFQPHQQFQPSFDSHQSQGQYQPHVQQPTPSPQPHRFQAPGKLNLNRTPDGFQYSFSSS